MGTLLLPVGMDLLDRRRRFEDTALPWMGAIYGTALRLTGRPEDARDLVQETYLRAYRTADNFRPGTNAKAWLSTILYSIFVNRYRKRQREPKMVSLEEMETRFWEISTPPAQKEAGLAGDGRAPSWTEREVERAVAELPESFRTAVLLVDVEEFSYEETAAVMDCPVGTVRSRLSRARKMLFVALEQYARRTGYPARKPEDR